MKPELVTDPSMRYLVEVLRLPRTYIVALVVGTLINLYGQVLVPYLRGMEEPTRAFLEEARVHPGISSLSVLLGYAFPLAVNATSAVLMRLSLRGMESRALFPDEKPDPVFRVNEEGRFVDMGTGTRRVFEGRSIGCAEDVFGRELWLTIRNGDVARPSRSLYLPRLGGWYVVRSSLGSSGLLNVYLAETVPPDGDGVPPSP